MQLPEGEYSRDQFIHYLLENAESVAPPDPRHRWLKIYVILSGDAPWRDSLFAEEEVIDRGEISEVRIKPAGHRSSLQDENYYVMEHKPGLLLFFTTAVKEHYERTLGDRLRRTRGITNMWSSPAIFDRQWKYVLRSTGGFVYRFMSRRSSSDVSSSRIRPTYRRRINYTGDDATEMVEEIREMYGVLPQSLYVKVGPDLIVHLTNEGLFSAKIMSRQAFELFFGMLETIESEILGLKTASEELLFRIEPLSEVATGQSKVVAIKAGLIRFGEPVLSGDGMRQLSKELASRGRFSLIDGQLSEGSLGFEGTLVDELKGSIFNISASEGQILLIPKYEATFETFLDFYRTVAEVTDSRAVFQVSR